MNGGAAGRRVSWAAERDAEDEQCRGRRDTREQAGHGGSFLSGCTLQTTGCRPVWPKAPRVRAAGASNSARPDRPAVCRL